MTLRLAPVALALLAAPLGAEEPAPFDAFSVWSASGAVVEAAPGVFAFAGEMRGPLFVDAGEGPVPAGEIVCVGALELEAATGRETGSARCRFVAPDGAAVFGRFACEGVRFVGCRGDFEVTGGEGRLAGASGRGPVVLRRYDTALVAGEDGSATELALGIAWWNDFALAAPAPQP